MGNMKKKTVGFFEAQNPEVDFEGRSEALTADSATSAASGEVAGGTGARGAANGSTATRGCTAARWAPTPSARGRGALGRALAAVRAQSSARPHERAGRLACACAARKRDAAAGEIGGGHTP